MTDLQRVPVVVWVHSRYAINNYGAQAVRNGVSPNGEVIIIDDGMPDDDMFYRPSDRVIEHMILEKQQTAIRRVLDKLTN